MYRSTSLAPRGAVCAPTSPQACAGGALALSARVVTCWSLRSLWPAQGQEPVLGVWLAPAVVRERRPVAR
eukprot:6474703-Alexandrium_andersonii.AAC.1